MTVPGVAKAEAKGSAGGRQRSCHTHPVLTACDLLQTLGHGAGDTVQSTKHKHRNLSLVPGTCVKSQAQRPTLETPALERQGQEGTWGYLDNQDSLVTSSRPVRSPASKHKVDSI